MSVWKRLLGLGRKDDPTLREAALRGGLPVARSGASVTAETALYVSTVLACARVYMNGTAQVPFRLMQVTGNKRMPAADKELGKLLTRKPNPWQTSYEFRETITLHAMLTGNAYVFVNRVGMARDIRELIPLEPKRVEVKRRPDMTLEYKVSNENGASQVFSSDAIWHIRGPSWNSWLGLEIIKLAREAVGLAITLEQAQSEFQKNGAQTSGVLATKDKLSPERFEYLSAWMDKHLPGGERFGKPMIVDDEAEYTNRSFSAVDQQLVESRKMQIEEICREFGVMPIMVGYSDKTATYASSEQMFLAHVVHTLSPWYKRIEESADANLLTEEDRDAGYYTKFFPNALMRGAAKDRSEFYKNALGDTQRPGYMTRNEVRELEDLNPVDGGDEFPALITKPSDPAPSDPSKEPTDA